MLQQYLSGKVKDLATRPQGCLFADQLPSVPSPVPVWQALKTGKSDRSGPTRVGKMPAMADFQFFNTKRLTELYEKEHAAEQHKNLMAQKEAQLKAQVGSSARMYVCSCVCETGSPCRSECGN